MIYTTDAAGLPAWYSEAVSLLNPRKFHRAGRNPGLYDRAKVRHQEHNA
jgi:hypothetical protein